MTVKEKIKKEIDRLPDKTVEQLLRYLNTIKVKNKKHRIIPTLHLKGQYDNINIRHQAYE